VSAAPVALTLADAGSDSDSESLADHKLVMGRALG